MRLPRFRLIRSTSDLVQHCSKIDSDSLVRTAKISKVFTIEDFLASPAVRFYSKFLMKSYYHYLRDHLVVIADISKPCVLRDLGEVGSHPLKLGKCSRLALSPKLL